MGCGFEQAQCSAPDARASSFASPKESSQRKGDPGSTPRQRQGFPALLVLSGAAQLGPTALRQCSPISPLKSPLLGVSQGGSHRTLTIAQRWSFDAKRLPLLAVFILPSVLSSSAGRNGKRAAASHCGRAERHGGRAFFLLTGQWRNPVVYLLKFEVLKFAISKPRITVCPL